MRDLRTKFEAVTSLESMILKVTTLSAASIEI